MSVTCDIQKVAAELVQEVEAQELPDDFAPSELWEPQVLAWIRHGFTNYDDLLARLAICAEFWERHGTDFCDRHADQFNERGCTLRERAYQELKGEATDAARLAWRTWSEKRKKGGSHDVGTGDNMQSPSQAQRAGVRSGPLAHSEPARRERTG